MTIYNSILRDVNENPRTTRAGIQNRLKIKTPILKMHLYGLTDIGLLEKELAPIGSNRILAYVYYSINGSEKR
jgi:hypothetical protein